jgi:hypothetical protein
MLRTIRRLVGRAPEGVDYGLWMRALNYRYTGYPGAIRDDTFVRAEVNDIEVALTRQFRTDPEFRSAQDAFRASTAAVANAVDEAHGITVEATQRIRDAEGCDVTQVSGRFLAVDGQRAVHERRTSQQAIRAAQLLRDTAEQSLARAEASAIDRLHVSALERRRRLDAYVDVLNLVLRHEGHSTLDPLPDDLTDELVRRAVRTVRLETSEV